MAFLDNNGLSYFWNKLKTKFLSVTGGKIENGTGNYTKIVPSSITLERNNGSKAIFYPNEMMLTSNSYDHMVWIVNAEDGACTESFIQFNNDIRILADTNEPNKIFLYNIKDFQSGKVKLCGVDTPTEDYDVSNKKYVDDAISSVSSSGGLESVQITLSSSDWTNKEQTVTVDGVLADETEQLITLVPSNDNQDEYYSCGIVCNGQAENSLTFKADEVPTSNLTVYVLLQGV